MVKRALILRPDFESLAGFRNSAACIDQVLRSRGFDIESCEGADATRAGILHAYDGLIENAHTDDAIVIYYVGRAALTTNREYAPDADLPRYIQNLVPTDYGETTEGDFRGISSFELSLQLAALTRKTKNVTLIFDCCFSGGLMGGTIHGDEPTGAVTVERTVRDIATVWTKMTDVATAPELTRALAPERAAPVPVPRPRSFPKLTRAGLTKHLQLARERLSAFDQPEFTRAPDAVRVAACGQTQNAYQLAIPPADKQNAIGIDLPAGGWIGAMTLRLAEILAEIGNARVSWASIGAELRSRLVIQSPKVEGPVARVPFSLVTVDAAIFPA
jgi:Caspase domain